MLALWGRSRRGEGAVSDQSWRSDERYRDLSSYSAADLAWEFLRRNPDYRADFRQTNEVASDGTNRADPARWARWGLTFPGGPGAVSRRARRVLAAGV